MVKDLKMTVLVDNIAALPLKEEWGLSILVEADGQRIMLDIVKVSEDLFLEERHIVFAL